MRWICIEHGYQNSIIDDCAKQDLQSILNHIDCVDRTDGGEGAMVSVIDVDLSQQQLIKHNPWTQHCQIGANLDGLLSSNTSTETPKKNSKLCSLADAIHILSDGFPIPGTYLVDMIWVISKEENIPIIEDNMDVFGAMMRLRMWHKMFVTFYCSRRIYLSRQLANWSKHMAVQIVGGPQLALKQPFPPGVVWRGGLQLTDQENGLFQHLEGFQLLSHHRDKNNEGTLPVPAPHVNETADIAGANDVNDNHPELSFHGSMTIVSEMELTEVPPHFISSARFLLVLPPIASSSLLEDSWKFLSVANSKKNYCYVLRLPLLSSEPPDGGSSGKLTTLNWKKRIASGKFQVSELQVSTGTADHRLFLLVGDGLCTAYSANLYALRDPSMFDSHACLTLAMRDATGSFVDGTNCRTLESVPRLAGEELDNLEGALFEAQKWAVDRFTGSQKGVQPADLMALCHEVGSQVLLQWKLNLSMERLESNPQPSPVNANGKSPAGIEMDDDPEAWPERQFLRTLSSQSAHDRLNDSLIKHFGAPTWAPCKASLMDVGDIQHIFKSDKKWEKVLLDSSKHYRSNSAPTVSLLASWSTAQYCNFHDIYYNRDSSSESKQFASNELQCRYLPTDTLSSANVMEIKDAIGRSSRAGSTSMMDGTQGDGRQTPSTPQPLVMVTVAETPTKQRRSRPAVNAVVRRSPRHKARPSRPPKTLSENHLKKLRGAVLDALELNRIRVQHPLFRACAKKLLEICQSYAKDVIGEGSTSQRFKEIAESQVNQVISFLRQKQQREERMRRSGK